jgi:NADH-quinone oxidoreductase subunit C
MSSDQDKSEPQAAADKPVGTTPAEPLKGEVSRTDSPGAGTSAAQPPPPPARAPAPPKPPPAGGEAKTEHKPPAPAAPVGPPDPAPPADVEVPPHLAALRSAFPDVALSYWVGDWTVIVPVDRLMEVARYLRTDPDAAFDFCSDATASDWPSRPERFDVVYSLYSTRHRRRVRLKTRAGENTPVASLSPVWPSANWLEREVYDLFGVNFVGHPDRRRILMPEDWQGHPQRKDYPLEGPGELLMENPLDWLKLRQARDEADIE